MFGNKEQGKITFYYDSDKLFNDISLMSAYMTKNLAGDAGSLMDEFHISDDEKDIYGVCVRQTLPNIYETMMKITSDAGNAFDDDAFVAIGKERKTTEKGEGDNKTLVELGENIGADGKDANAQDGTLGRFSGTYIEFNIEDNASYNKNVLNLVDATLLNCLKHGILAEFYSICINADLYRAAHDKFTTSLFQLKQRLFQLKKKSVSSQLS